MSFRVHWKTWGWLVSIIGVYVIGVGYILWEAGYFGDIGLWWFKYMFHEYITSLKIS